MSGKTEWEDALIAHGIIDAPEEQPDQDELWADEQEQREVNVMENPFGHLEGKTLDQLAEHEDEVPEDEMEILRRKRLEELKRQAARNKFGRVLNISEPEWKTEVTNAEEDVWVVVLLDAPGKEECKLIEQIFTVLAKKFKDVKFVKIEGRLAVRNYPDANCPTVFVYLKGEIKLQFIGIDSMGGLKASASGMEWALSRIGAVKTELTESPYEEQQRTRINRLDDARRRFQDEGDDWLDRDD